MQKATVLEQNNLGEDDVRLILSIVDKAAQSYRDPTSMQKYLSEELCRQYKLTVGVNVMEESPKQLERPQARPRLPNLKLKVGKYFCRVWIRADDILYPTEKRVVEKTI